MPDECVILADGPGALVELCGISTLERLLRTLQRCGIARATILSTTPAEIAQRLGQSSWARADLEFTIRERPPGPTTVQEIVDLWPEAAARLLVIQGDVVFDIRLLRALLAQTSSAMLIDSSAPETNRGKLCGAALLQREWAAARNVSVESALLEGLKQHTVEALDVANQPLYDPGLRRSLRPFCFPAPALADKQAAESVLFDSAQKGTLDFPAWIHAPIEKFLLRYLCRTSITPNQLTISWAIAACLTTIFFATGHLIWGIVLALVVGILDGLDGKQARIKVETTAGGKIEHHLDSFFDVVWPTALAFHFYASGQLPSAFYYLAVLLIGEGVDGIAKAIIYSAYARLMIAPGLFDQLVRLIGGRRNIYIWVLVVAVILGAPAKALIVMAWWELMTAVIDIPQAARMSILRQKRR
jgi:1L-myo-inositol 1-phosphate cytidylyltransferase / CDP-L-myo-inositol myo-inositolphosphotransferase